MKHSLNGRNPAALFNRMLDNYPDFDSPSGITYTRELGVQFPWFSLARFAALRMGGSGKQWQYLWSRIPFKPYPSIIIEETGNLIFKTTALQTNSNDVVDNAIKFFSTLSSPREFASLNADNETIPSLESEVNDSPLVTETLAQIYLTQGHTQKAIEIYLKLSLKNPEKSGYFANLINNITSQ